MPQEKLRITISPSQFVTLLRAALANDDVTIPRMSGEALKGRVVALQFSMIDGVSGALLNISANGRITIVSLVISKERNGEKMYAPPLLKAESFS